MERYYRLNTIETHTAGEPTRILMSGINLFPLFGRSVAEQRDMFAEKFDHIRELLMREPRGHDDMFGAVPVPPEDDEADIGVIFMHTTGYLDMCGHGTIGLVTALIEREILPEKRKIKIETPAGIVESVPVIKENKVENVRVKNVDSFFVGDEIIELDLADIKSNISVNLAYSGNLVGLVDVRETGFSVKKDDLDTLKRIGIELRDRLNDKGDFVNPFSGEKIEVSLIEFYETRKSVDKNLVVFADGSIDRSPCGTGTCAKMTYLHHLGKLDVNEEYRYRSVLNTEFEGKILEAGEKEGIEVITPEVSGSAYITGTSTFVLDPDDPLDGFSLYK